MTADCSPTQIHPTALVDAKVWRRGGAWVAGWGLTVVGCVQGAWAERKAKVAAALEATFPALHPSGSP